MLLPTGTLLVMLATVLVAFERIGTAAVVGGVGDLASRALHLIATLASTEIERAHARSTGPLSVYGTLSQVARGSISSSLA